MSDRTEQARAEAVRRTIPTSENYDYLDLRELFAEGVVWANPQPRTITRWQTFRAWTSGEDFADFADALKAAGIEVEDSDE